MTGAVTLVEKWATLSVMELGVMEILGIKGGKGERVGKELCYRKAETLGDAEEAARWWM
jgi:hypothetical protein